MGLGVRRRHALANPPACTTDVAENTVTGMPRPNRHLFNKLLGQLYHCLQQGSAFDEVKAFPQTVDAAA
ncbi:hypothetical protein Mkiyose1088_24090 [Mycobacterium kiyosense]|uniref:IS110 family transposase n=1 Tax=Mycobacterium kiyosense TaxID=2871094 RepID=A0A9P3V0S6_9MYCO|nr:hypothetical protein IWGMT90018_26010 [Mycobacterium kiyosense]BDE14560.1 hypothetical protein MKCMC460_34200 [Mycobacterium sp. 20KCMC460]GLB92615.1 hypothetical protein SRL2020130_54320 [Mycobacterium kiyosense]GLC10803.1 hypothetical protein SRL2020411_54490 [Mycobacterium kiyosense]GLC16762.1 hypothetical protein SRL2020448_53650 [Mycobacterium kiyosense]